MIESRYYNEGGSSSSSSIIRIRRCKNNNHSNNKNYGGVSWSWLCEDLVLEILCRLPGKSLIRFKCVSKGWYFLISNVVIRRMLPLRLSGVYTMYRNLRLNGIKYVSMMADNRDDTLSNPWPRFFSSETDIINKELPLPPGCSPFKVFACDFLDCCNGLFLFFHRIRRQYYLWSREPPQFVMIPPPFDMPSLAGYAALAFDVKESVHYRVVSFYDPIHPWPRRVSPRIRRLDIFYSETGKWIEYKVEYKPPLNDADMVTSSIYLDGAIYRLSSSRHLVRYDLEQVNVTTFELPVITSIRRLEDNVVEVIGLSSGCLHYAFRDGSPLLSIWMFSDYQWILKRSVSFQELRKIPSTKDFFLEIPPNSYGFRPLAFHPCCDAVFLWSFRTILLYHYKHNEIQVVYFPPLDSNYSLRKPPHMFFPYSQCLVHLKSIG